MTTDEYVPSEEQVRVAYMGDRIAHDGLSGKEALGEWTAFLARVRRDAAREALDGLMVHAETREALSLTGQEQIKWRHVRLTARNYGRAHYPEETP